MQSLNKRSFCIALVFCSLCIYPWHCSCSTARSFKQAPQKKPVPAVFVYGDSIVDPGNNNHLLTIVKSNFPPYGKDFEDGKATGRFSNGRIPTDFIVDRTYVAAEEIGVKKYLPAFLDPSLREADLLTGVSFASAGSGYDPLTSRMLFVKSLDEQLDMFKEYIKIVMGIVGVERTNFIVNNSISVVITGNNDLGNTYFGNPFRNIQYDVDSYTNFMLNFAISHVKKLYEIGVRKIGVCNIAPIGCVPILRTLAGGLWRHCSKHLNDAAQLFNSKLEDELLYLSTKLPNSKVVYIDMYSILLDLILNNTHYGFEVVDKGCCGTGLIEGSILCNGFSSLCEVDKYLFWDSVHPTEKGYRILVHQLVEKYLNQFF